MPEKDADPDTYREVTDLLSRLSDAISHGDAARVVAEFAAGDDVVMFGSEEAETAYGHEELAVLWKRVLSRGQRYKWQWSEQHVARRGAVAWLSATATVTLEESGATRGIPYRLTIVLVREAERWAIAQYHGSEPAAPW
jgi:ketosteroid isomerase-like protein